VFCDEAVHTFLSVHISKSTVDNNVNVCYGVVDIAQDSLSNIKPSLRLNNLGFNDNAKNLMGNEHYETENITVLNSCTRESIDSTNKKNKF